MILKIILKSFEFQCDFDFDFQITTYEMIWILILKSSTYDDFAHHWLCRTLFFRNVVLDTGTFSYSHSHFMGKYISLIFKIEMNGCWTSEDPTIKFFKVLLFVMSYNVIIYV